MSQPTNQDDYKLEASLYFELIESLKALRVLKQFSEKLYDPINYLHSQKMLLNHVVDFLLISLRVHEENMEKLTKEADNESKPTRSPRPTATPKGRSKPKRSPRGK